MLDFIKDYWFLLLALVGFASGYAELKANHKGLRKDHDDFVRRHDQQRVEDNARQEGMLKEVRDDIKLLLQRRGD